MIEGLRCEAADRGEGSSHAARVSALGLLGRHLGMFRDRVEHVLSTRLVIVEEIVDGNADPAGATPPPPG